MTPGKTYIDAEKLEAIIKESGLPYAAQKGFVKVQGPKGRQVYVAATKRVGRVDLSGFETEWGVTPHCGPFGNVKQQLDFSKDEADVLEDFRKTLEHMKTLEAVERKPRPIGQTRASAPAKGWSPETLEQRKARIEKVAKEMGVKVSPKAFHNEA